MLDASTTTTLAGVLLIVGVAIVAYLNWRRY